MGNKKFALREVSVERRESLCGIKKKLTSTKTVRVDSHRSLIIILPAGGKLRGHNTLFFSGGR